MSLPIVKPLRLESLKEPSPYMEVFKLYFTEDLEVEVNLEDNGQLLIPFNFLFEDCEIDLDRIAKEATLARSVLRFISDNNLDYDTDEYISEGDFHIWVSFSSFISALKKADVLMEDRWVSKLLDDLFFGV